MKIQKERPPEQARQPSLALPPECRIAVVHEWLVQYGGSEKVLAAILSLFPKADLFSICDFLPQQERIPIGRSSRATSFIQRLPGSRRHYRNYLPLMPLAVEQLDLSGYDLVISNSHAVAKGVITGPGQLHVSYTHSPMRYAWDLQHQYLQEANLEHGIKSLFARLALHYLRLWDYRSAQAVDAYMANSHHVARRIRKFYNRESEVVYPPIELSDLPFQEHKDDYYLVISRLVPYKLVGHIVRAFRGTRRKLVIIGDGSERKRVIRIAAGSANIEFLGIQPRERLVELLAGARALVHLAYEDFGMAMVEALGCGTPVIAYAAGGAPEIVYHGTTGWLFPEQSIEALRQALDDFEACQSIRPTACADSAVRFAPERFRTGFVDAINNAWIAHEVHMNAGIPGKQKKIP